MKQTPSKHVLLVRPAEWSELADSDINEKLLQACISRHIPIARRLLHQGANVNCRHSDYMTPLHIAAEYGDVDLIQLLCDQPDINVEIKTIGGLTPLHTAALLGHTDVIAKLLENHASANCKDNFGRCPLHYSALEKDVESARVLIKNNARVNAYDIFDESPLFASTLRRPYLPMIRLLLRHGASVISPSSKTSLGLLLESILLMREKSDLRIVKILLQRGRNINVSDPIGLRTPLHIAAMNGNLELAKYLIECGADLHRKNRAGKTALEVALMFQNLNIAYIIEKGILNYSLFNGSESTISSREC